MPLLQVLIILNFHLRILTWVLSEISTAWLGEQPGTSPFVLDARVFQVRFWEHWRE